MKRVETLNIIIERELKKIDNYINLKELLEGATEMYHNMYRLYTSKLWNEENINIPCPLEELEINIVRLKKELLLK